MIDWTALRHEIRIFLAALAFFILLPGTLFYIHMQSSQDWTQSHNQLQHARLRYETASSQKAILDNYRQRFDLLKKNHILGDEQRLDWAETIQASSMRHGIPSVKFNLEQRGTTALPEDITGLTVYTSRMRLDMTLLHEGDLFNLLSDLVSRAQGIFGIHSCALRQENTQADFAPGNGLTGSCTLYWYTLGEEVEPVYDEDGNLITPDMFSQDDSGEE